VGESAESTYSRARFEPAADDARPAMTYRQANSTRPATHRV